MSMWSQGCRNVAKGLDEPAGIQAGFCTDRIAHAKERWLEMAIMEIQEAWHVLV